LSADSGFTLFPYGDDGQDHEGVLRLTGLSYAHPTVAADRRAPLSFEEGSYHRARARVAASGHQVFLLSTCLRVEIVWVGGPELAPDLLTSLYGDHSMSELAVIRTDQEVFLHLCRIAAGLESPLVGETEVLSQFRRAVAGFNQSSDRREGLARILESAIGVGRSTRRFLDPAPHGSLASVAARAVAPAERVAILGGGAMARAAALHLAGAEVSIFTRRPGVIAGNPSSPWEEVPEALATYPAVISTVPGGQGVLSEPVILEAFARRSQPLRLVDLGMPPAFGRRGETDQVSYLGVDDLAGAVGGLLPVEAEQALASEADLAWRGLTTPDRVGSIINAMVDQAERAVEDEVRRFANRLRGAEDPEAVLQQLAHTVARRILHLPISFVGSKARGPEAIEAVAEAFGVDDA
jgi:glutamyl-tRNA reductase